MCENEAFISKDKRILSFQCHPEYSDHFISKYDERVAIYAKTPLAQTDLILND
jgi:GMP synthase-like glutamine amidotransferase